MATTDSGFVVDFPTLGFLAADWMEAHCVVPSGPDLGAPFVLDGWQLEAVLSHYRVKPDIVFDVEAPPRASAFFYRRSIVVGPQKSGKSPWGAAMCLFEGAGPSLFAGWASGGEIYSCADNGCGCGWEYAYEPGEPLGRVRVKSLIQILAAAESQTNNIFGPLVYMVRNGPLGEFLLPRGEFVRLPNEGKIEWVSSAAKSKLGNPIDFAVGDESGLYVGQLNLTWQTMRRGLAGMGGRSIEITNPPDPMEVSSALLGLNSNRPDIYVRYRKPPSGLSYLNKADRAKIHKFVYSDAPWVPLESVEAEAAELIETDPAQAERFFGNRMVQGLGAFMSDLVWDETSAEVEIAEGSRITLGFDGSVSGDWTALRAVTIDRHRFTPVYGPDLRPTVWNPEEWGGSIPRNEVYAAVDEIFKKYKVERFYIDPRHWETAADEWALKYGDDVVVTWPTYVVNRMFAALDRYKVDSLAGVTSHDSCVYARAHALNARRVAKPGDKYIVGKPAEHAKIDVLMADVLAYEAASDALSAGWSNDSGYFRLPR